MATPLPHFLRSVLLVGLVLFSQAGLAQRSNWATAPRHSAGIAPDPVRLSDTAIVQVYTAPTYGWRGFFAVHPWIIFKRKGDSAYTRYDVVGWRAPEVVQRNYAVPDGLWYGSTPSLLDKATSFL